MQTRTRKLWSIGLRVVVAVAALAWTFSRVSLSDLLAAAERIAPTTLAVAFLLGLTGFVVGALRWRALLRAYGGRNVPSVAALTRRYLESGFYNTFLPGNVGGEVLRGHSTRNCFDGAASSYLVVAIERVLGLAGLLLLAAIMLSTGVTTAFSDLRWLAPVGLAFSVMFAAAPLLARRVRVPGKIGQALATLPRLERPWFVGFALGCSVITHAITAVSGYLFLSVLLANLDLLECLSLIPVALASVYFPTIAGLGVREAAFVVVLGGAGVSAADATATSLGMFSIQLALSLLGGALHFARREATAKPAVTQGSGS